MNFQEQPSVTRESTWPAETLSRICTAQNSIIARDTVLYVQILYFYNISKITKIHVLKSIYKALPG